MRLFRAGFALILICCLLAACESSLIVRNGTTSTAFLAVPLHFGNSPNKFVPVSGFLVLANTTDRWLESYRASHATSDANPPLIIADFYSGAERPYLEHKLMYWTANYAPKAVVIFGETDEGFYSELGQANLYKYGIDTSSVSIPILNANWTTWFSLRERVLNGSILNVTVDDSDSNHWFELRQTWWFPTWMSISVVWALANSITCIVLLVQIPHQRTMAVVVLYLELASNLLRLPFFLDPFIMWLLPQPVIYVFFSMSWPVHIAVAIIVVFFWIELTSQTDMRATGGFLTSRRWPAAVAVVLVAIVEYSAASVRAALGPSHLVIYGTALVYLLIYITVAVTYFHVYAQVRRFIMQSVTMKANMQKMIQRVSIRLLGTGISFLVLIILELLTALWYYNMALGQSVIQAAIFWTLSAGSSLTILAFIESVREYKSHSLSSSKRSSKPDRDRSHTVSADLSLL